MNMPITDPEDAPAALEELQARYTDLVDAASDWLWEVDEDLRFTYISEDVRKYNGGIDPSFYYGKTRIEMADTNPADPDDRERHKADLRARRPFRNFRFTHIGRNGSRHSWSISGSPVFDSTGSFRGYRGLGRDITERAGMIAELGELNAELEVEIKERKLGEVMLRAAHDDLDQKVRDRTAELENVNIVLRNEILERRLAQRATSDSETRYRELAELSPEGMIVHVDGKIIFANDSLARILGYASPSDLIGTMSIDLIAPESRSDVDRRRALLNAGGGVACGCR